MEGEPTKITEDDRKLIKTNIVELMLKSPDSIQRQLSEAISIVGREDFPDKWNDLLGVRILYKNIFLNSLISFFNEIASSKIDRAVYSIIIID